MMTVEAFVDVQRIPQLYKTARELGIDMITSDQVNNCLLCHFMIHDYGDLISLGWLAGVDSYYTKVASPMKELIEHLETGIAKVQNQQSNKKDTNV